MTGIVKSENGQPVADAEVYAENTLQYNVSQPGMTDAQGHHRIALPKNELGTGRSDQGSTPCVPGMKRRERRVQVNCQGSMQSAPFTLPGWFRARSTTRRTLPCELSDGSPHSPSS